MSIKRNNAKLENTNVNKKKHLKNSKAPISMHTNDSISRNTKIENTIVNVR